MTLNVCGTCDCWARLKGTHMGLCDNPTSPKYHAATKPDHIQQYTGFGDRCIHHEKIPEAIGHDKRSAAARS